MEEPTRHHTLKPHKYPILIKITGAFIVALFFYSLCFVPQYFSASKNLKTGEKYLDQNDYSQAITSLEKVLGTVPSAKKAKILLAITYFSNDDQTDDENGLYYLQDITIDDSDWQKISKVMPSEYQELFETIKK